MNARYFVSRFIDTLVRGIDLNLLGKIVSLVHLGRNHEARQIDEDAVVHIWRVNRKFNRIDRNVPLRDGIFGLRGVNRP